MDKLLLTVEEAGEVLGIRRSLAYGLVKRGALPSIRVGSLIRVPTAALREWVEQQTSGGAPATREPKGSR